MAKRPRKNQISNRLPNNFSEQYHSDHTHNEIDGNEEGMRNLPDWTLKHLGKRFEKVSLTRKRKNSNFRQSIETENT
jgi:hypothetical protein